MKSFLASLALATALVTPAFAADQYKFDPSHSQVLFSYDHIGFSTTWGLISGFDGTATIDQENLANSSVEITMTLKDVFDTGWPARNDHFLSADFFNVADNPVATFKSTSVEPTGDKTAKITGDLTLNGITKSVVLDATVNQIGKNPINQKDWAGFDATTTLKRSDFNAGKFAPAVSDEVELRISVELEKVGDA